jgi:hypothetical protein
MPSRLAARLRRLEAQRQASDEPHGQGLSSLLAYAGCSPAEDLATETPPTGLAWCLWEIRHASAKEPPA